MRRQCVLVQAFSVEWIKRVRNTPWPANGYPFHCLGYLSCGGYLRRQCVLLQAFSVEWTRRVRNTPWPADGYPLHGVGYLSCGG